MLGVQNSKAQAKMLKMQDVRHKTQYKAQEGKTRLRMQIRPKMKAQSSRMMWHKTRKFRMSCISLSSPRWTPQRCTIAMARKFDGIEMLSL
jgi:hypothetical protein